MSTLTVATFLGMLAVLAALGVLAVIVVWVLDRVGVASGAFVALRGAVAPVGLWLAFVVALTATSGSLYFSEVAGFPPCALCWYQRIAMYPLVIILGVAAWRGDRNVIRYAGPLAVIGGLISIWHIGVERLPGLPTGSCSLSAPCDLIWVERFGFVTIPVMALTGFLAILTLLFAYAGRGTDTETEITS